MYVGICEMTFIIEAKHFVDITFTVGERYCIVFSDECSRGCSLISDAYKIIKICDQAS